MYCPDVIGSSFALCSKLTTWYVSPRVILYHECIQYTTTEYISIEIYCAILDLALCQLWHNESEMSQEKLRVGKVKIDSKIPIVIYYGMCKCYQLKLHLRAITQLVYYR